MAWKKYYLLSIYFVVAWGLLGPATASAQTGVITGTVEDAEAQTSLPGANVAIVGTTIGASADADGRFVITGVEAGTYDLRASFVGYRAAVEEGITVSAGDTTEVVFSLRGGLTLEEMVVVGYGEQKRRNLTGSVASISADDIEDRPVESVEEALQGKAAGINIVQNSGSPGAAFTVRIRGTGTIGNNTPLYVVDGVPVNGDISFLNTNDIASIDVLKGAAAAAIYGTQAGNGAVLITTKKGRDGKREVTFASSVGALETPRTIDMLPAAEYAALRNEALINDGSPPAYPNPSQYIGQSTDWQDAVFRTGLRQNHNLAVSGGNEGFTYRLSGGYLLEDGIIEGSNFERYNVQVNTTFDVSEKLTVGETLTFTRSSREALPETDDVRNVLIQTLQMDPTVPVYNADGSYSSPQFSNTNNPVAQIDFNNNEFRLSRMVGNAFAEYEPIENLQIRSDIGIDLRYGNNYYFLPTYNVSVDFSNPSSIVARYSDRISSIVSNTTATYSLDVSDHNVTLLAGTTIEKNKFESIDASTLGTPSNDPSLRYLGAGTQVNGATGSAAESRLLSFFGRANYDYKDRYLLTVVSRYDGSSRFGRENRFAFFPSVSGAWRISDEPFFPETDLFDDVKLRAGWGQNGNQEVGDYSFAALINSGQDYVFGTGETRVPGSAPLGSAAPDLKWETTTQTNVGLDVAMLNEQLNLTAEYFIKTTDDVLLYPPNIPTSGLSVLSPSNIGKIENRGFEASVRYFAQPSESFSFDVGANFATIKNEVIELVDGVDIIQGFYRQGAITLTEAGGPVGAFYGHRTDGLFQSQDEIDQADARDGDASTAYQAGAQPGDIRFKDLNGDGVITDDDRTFIGNPTPDFTYGFTSNVEYRNFDLNLFIQGSYGNELFAAYKYYTEGAALFNLSTEVRDRWTGPGTSNSMPRLTADDPNRNTRISDRYVEDGSYLRLKNIQLGYTLPQSLFERMNLNVERLRLYVGAQNLFTLTGYDGYTPEIGVGDDDAPTLDRGIDRAIYPQPRIYTGGINLTF